MEQTKNNLIELLPKHDMEIVEKAISFSQKIHSGENRYDGQPKILHLLNVATLTYEAGLDTTSVMAALLHEIEINEHTEQFITKELGSEVLNIIKDIKSIKKATDAPDTPDEIINKYILNSNKDLRGLIIKILDTSEDMKTISYVPLEKRKDSLRKALSIYSPLAEYLDLNETKKEMDENAFKEYLPNEYESISKRMKEKGVDEELLNRYFNTLSLIMKDLHFPKRIEGRIKSKYSIYNKLKKYEKEWISPEIERVPDLIAFRILTDTEDSCFHILEKLMDAGEMDYDKFDDYISNPKPNGYKAVQFPMTFGSISDIEVEVQILTNDMHYFNTYGPASHIAYKASKSRYAKPSNKYDWVEDVHKQIHRNKRDRANERNLPIHCNIFTDEVFVFTPKGKIIDLNKGDTVLDFAFRLHSQIGNSAIAAEVNGKAAKLSEILQTGDTVMIKTDKNKHCQSIDSLQYVNSLTSKFKIRKQLSKNTIK